MTDFYIIFKRCIFAENLGGQRNIVNARSVNVDKNDMLWRWLSSNWFIYLLYRNYMRKNN